MKLSKDAIGFVKTDKNGNQIAMAVSKDGMIKEFKIIYKNKHSISAQDIIDMCDKK